MILADSGVVFDKENHTYRLGDKQLWGITGMLSSQLFPEKYDFVPQKVLQRAANRGSIIHEACDHYDKTGEVKRIEVRWYENVLKENNIKVLSSEYIVTDFEHFASPIDKVVEINNEVHLLDVKTTSALDYEYLSWQLSVYKYLFGLVNPEIKIGGLGAIWIRDGATYHEVQEKPAEAIEELKRSIELDPQAVQPHALLALVYSAQGKVDLAADEYTLAFENASKHEPENVEIYKSLGAIYLQQKKLKQAEGIFKLILKLTPQDAEAHFYLGSVYYDLKDYPAAEKELKNALKLKPDYHEVLNFLGYFYLEQDRNIDTAGAMIEQALALDPENGAYLDSLGWYYYKKGKFKEALSYLEKAAYFLSDPVIYEHLGDVFLKLGSRENAILNLEKSLKLNSEQDKVKEKLFKLTNHGE